MIAFVRQSVILVAFLAGTRGGPALSQTPPPPEPSATPDATAAAKLYARSVAAMRALEIPSFVTFASAWNSTGMRFDIYRDDDRIVLAIGSGRDFSDRHAYAVAYRRADRMLALTEGSADRFAGGSHFLDPTWDGAYDLLRYGFQGAAPPGAVTPQPVETATPSSAAMPTIGTVTAISAAYYRVEDAGAGSCPSGAPGEVLKLTALRDPRAHPLTAVTIDVANDRFCSMRFNVNESGVFGITGNYEVHFADGAGYWLVSGGAFDLAVRVLGISAKHVALQWNNSDFATPADISATQFQTPAPIPKT